MLATDASGKSQKISPSHLERRAYVYVRQSTAEQVLRVSTLVELADTLEAQRG